MKPENYVGIGRRLASLLYDSLLVLAVIFIASFLFISLVRDAQSGLVRHVYQLYLLLVGSGYYIWFWLKSGQTLAMKTWRIRLERDDGSKLDWRTAIKRALLALPSYILGIGVIWVLFDRDGKFLHDRLCGTRMVNKPHK